LARVARYVHEHEPWAIYLKPFGVEKSLADWLRTWKGDGIIAAVAELDTEQFSELGVPIVDILGVHRQPDVPVVHANDQSVGRLGAEHLLERGFRNFGFVEYPHFWSTERRVGFESLVRNSGFACASYKLQFPTAGSGGP